MQTIKKYLLFAFLIENLMAQVSEFHYVSNILFYVFLGVGAIFAFDSNNWSAESRQKYMWIIIVSLIFIVYEFVIGFEFVSQKTLLYLIAKITTFFIIITSLNYNNEFYEEKMLFALAAIISSFTLYGLISGGETVNADERAELGFGNSNSTGAYGAIASGIIMFYTKNHKFDWKCSCILFIGLFAILAAGSRAGFLMLFIYLFCRFGISYKTVIVGLLFFVISMVILPDVGVETIGMQRFLDTLNGEIGSNRDEEREAGIWMIEQSPWKGWGFGAKNQGYALVLSELPSHNGYIEMTKWMGYPSSFVFFLTLFATFVSYWITIIKHNIKVDFFFATVIVLFIKAMYEVLFTGVHEFETNFFFVSLAILSSRTYYLKNDKNYTVNF